MRLIDADKLAEYIAENEHSFIFAITNKDMTILEDIIFDIPTAYDVDKVVRQLKKDKFIDCETVLSDVHQGYNAGLSRAIEIVKAGGKNDD